MSERLTGTVKRFNDKKGFGFITTENGGEDLFVHQSSIRTEGFRALGDGESLEFQIETDGDSRTKAIDVTGLEEGPFQGHGSDGRGPGGERIGRGGGGSYGASGDYGGGGGYGGSGGGCGNCFKCEIRLRPLPYLAHKDSKNSDIILDGDNVK